MSGVVVLATIFAVAALLGLLTLYLVRMYEKRREWEHSREMEIEDRAWSLFRERKR